LINKILIPIFVLVFCCTIIVANNANAANGNGKQLLIASNINTIDSFGKWNNTDYTDFYNVRNLFDNQTNTWSFWSQYGKSGFVISLNPINEPVCSVQIDTNNPKNTPFHLRLGNPETFVNYDGNLDTNKETINIDNCIKDVKGISMTFDAPKKWTTLSEFKLFSNATNIPDPEPPVCKEGYHYDPVKKKCVLDVGVPGGGGSGNVTHIIIANSTATMDISNSKLVLNIDGNTQIIENHQSDDDNEEEEQENEEDDEN
jgi:hypothetical protein